MKAKTAGKAKGGRSRAAKSKAKVNMSAIAASSAASSKESQLESETTSSTTTIGIGGAGADGNAATATTTNTIGSPSDVDANFAVGTHDDDLPSLSGLVPGLEATKSFESNFSLGSHAMSLGCASHGLDLGMGMGMDLHSVNSMDHGEGGMAISLQHDAELMLSLSKSGSHDDQDDPIRGILGQTNDKSGGAKSNDAQASDALSPSKADSHQDGGAPAVSTPVRMQQPPPSFPSANGTPGSSAVPYPTHGPHPPPLPHGHHPHHPHHSPYRPMPGRPHYPYAYHHRFGPPPPRYGPPGPPPPGHYNGPYASPAKTANGTIEKGGDDKKEQETRDTNTAEAGAESASSSGKGSTAGGDDKKDDAAAPYAHHPHSHQGYGPPPGHPFLRRGPPGPPPPRGTHGPHGPPPPRYGHHPHPQYRPPHYGARHLPPPPPHHHAYPPHHGYGPPQPSAARPTDGDATSTEDTSKASGAGATSVDSSNGDSKSGKVSTDSAAPKTHNGSEGATSTSEKGMEEDTDISKQSGPNDDDKKGLRELQAGESSPSATIDTVGSTVSTGSQGTVGTVGSIRKKRTFDGISTTSSSGSAFAKGGNSNDAASVSSGTSSVMSSPNRRYPPAHHHYHHPSHPGYGYHYAPHPGHATAYPPHSHHHLSSNHSQYYQSPSRPATEAKPESAEGHGGTEAAKAGTSSHPLGMFTDEQMRHHRRSNSNASTASSLSSMGGLSAGSTGGASRDDNDDTSVPSSPKRRRQQGPPAYMMSPGGGSVSSSARIRLDNLTVQDSKSTDSKDDEATSDGKKKGVLPQIESSTSPTNNRVEAAKTPISKNTKTDDSGAFDFAPGAEQKGRGIRGDSSAGAEQQDQAHQAKDASNISSAFRKGSSASASSVMKTPSLYSKNESFSFDFGDMIKDDPLLNSQLRGQSFTPLPHNGSGIKGISNQLSWSISPHLGDIADWADADIKTGKTASGPLQPSLSTDGGGPKSDGADVSTADISPMAINAQMDSGAFAPSLSFWQDEDVAAAIGDGKDHEKAMPLPRFYDPSMPPPSRSNDEKASQERNQHLTKPVPSQQSLGTLTPRHPMHPAEQRGPGNQHHPRGGSQQMRDGPPQIMPSPRYNYMSTPGSYGPHGDRVRNLRGRVPEGAPNTHMPPPPPSSYYYHHNLTSPMVGGSMMKPGMWGSPHVAHPPHPMTSPPHRRPIRPLDLTPSKRKCVPLKPPLPSKFQGDAEKAKATPMPEFTNLVNFPAHISQKQPVTLPDGMRCCVMCGQACQCNGTMKGTKKMPPQAAMKGGPAPGIPPAPANGYAIIPTQNKGLCTACDVNVWVVVQSGLEIKWCKGCKNFRPWASFGDKGLATKCVRCRERQREKYALQKEAKERKKSSGS